MTTKIYDFEFLAPVQRDHVVVVTRVQHARTDTITDVVVDQTAGATYCSDHLHQTLWSDDAAMNDPVALLVRQGWTVLGIEMGRVVSVLMTTRDEGDGNILRTRVMMAPVADGPYR